SLRHFYASSLINEGVDPAAVSSALGHSVIGTTTSIYCHTFQQAQARAGDAIANVLDFSKKKHDDDPTEPPKITMKKTQAG
ncbi:MAG: tyrosine-type recombinase/integrase, partial [Ruminococcus sp.]|nr:tyrosine-type recombinase/integrase [Ruminococcus sp.]